MSGGSLVGLVAAGWSPWVLLTMVAVSGVGLASVFVSARSHRAGAATPAFHVPWSHPLALVGPVVFTALFVADVHVLVGRLVPPLGALDVVVRETDGRWDFDYGRGVRSDQLRVPQGRPVALRLESDGSGRRFAVAGLPVRLVGGGGRSSHAWFRPSGPGSHRLVGPGARGALGDSLASEMIVVAADEFEVWRAEISSPLARMSPVEAGAQLVVAKGCTACHSLDGTPRLGPSFLGISGREVAFTDGTRAASDPAYLRQSILEPTARIVAGFQPVMPAFGALLSEREVGAIVAFLASLDAHAEAN